jgi:HEAT repeat protein
MMNQLLEWLSEGDLRSDGMANEVTDFVLNDPLLFGDLYEGLSVDDDVVRGHAADALEKISRSRPDLLVQYLPDLIRIAQSDSVAMVRWHLTMLFGYLSVYEESVEDITSVLLQLLQDESVFVRSWAIVSLCIIGRLYSRKREEIVNRITPLQRDDSIAIKSKVRKAIDLLVNEAVPFPKGWVKSKHLKLT